ncbi:hypothetical protein [Pantoea ananatis]|uniref:hypothetical protein n=1 Tax=Pantoea ananas TaxID=553 RepID=UPI00299F6F2A|nr:hypothetical protein [Pantoea ananatis]
MQLFWFKKAYPLYELIFSQSGYIYQVWPKRLQSVAGAAINRLYGGFTVILQDDEQAHLIIGEAALQLALADREINIASLMNELRHMATDDCSDDRLSQISEARAWLRTFITPDNVMPSVPYLQTLAGLNEEKN